MEQKKKEVVMTRKDAHDIVMFINCEIAIIIVLLMVIAGLIIALCAKPKTKSVTVEVPVEVPVEVHITDIEYVEVVRPSGTATYTLELDDYADQFTHTEVEMLARAIWGEAGSVKSTTEQAAVAWVILNQVDSDADGMRSYHSIADVLANPDNIQGYWAKKNSGTVPDEYKELAYDVLCRYYAEKDGWDAEAVKRVIPADYLYWMGDGTSHNYFVVEYHEGSLNYCKANAWDWTLTTPYAN